MAENEAASCGPVVLQLLACRLLEVVRLRRVDALAKDA
jgi:hypothetical protein